MKKIGILFVTIIMVVLFAVSANALESTGQCGDNVYWDYDSTTGELVISGEGAMWDYDYSKCPSPFSDSDIKTVVIEKGVTSIGRGVFHFARFYCSSLISIDIPDTVTNIEEYAFAGCQSLENVNIPDSVISIGDYAFAYCTKLSDVIIPDSVTTIGEGAFGYSGLESVIIGKNVENIEYGAFGLCTKLKSLTISDGVKYIAQEAFCGLLSLDSVTIPASVKKIDYQAFYYIPYTEKIIIESLDAEIGDLSIGATEMMYPNNTREEVIDMWWYGFIMDDPTIGLKLNGNVVYLDKPIHTGTIYCHAGSTAEAYAIKNEAKYELTHFFKGEWTYDYDNMIRTRKCIHCDELETEELQVAVDNKVEVIVPGTDTKVEVEIVDNSNDNYILVENKLSETVDTNFNILKVFDINLKNNDGVHVKADGTVKVKLPLDWEKDGDYKVYRLNDDGTLTDMNAYRQGSHMIFDTDHFSIYVIVEENVQEETPEVTPDEDNKVDFFTKIIDLIKSFFEFIINLFKK